MKKFEIGDLVKIGTVKGSDQSVFGMYKFKGRVGRITDRHEHYKNLVQIEDTDDWWFDENILTPSEDNRRYIDAFLEGKSVEVISDHGVWIQLALLTPEIARRKMRFAKSEEALAIEKEIDVLKETVVALEKQKNDIISHIKDQKSRISRLEKKLETLS